MADQLALSAPWTQKTELSPIYDTAGRLVSFTQHAPQIVRAVNFSHFMGPVIERALKIIEKATGPSACAADTEALRLIAVQMRQCLDATIPHAAE